MEDYLGFYSVSFTPEEGKSRSDWEEERRVRILHPEYIEVSLAVQEVLVEARNAGTIRFLQSYGSDRFNDLVTKELGLVRDGKDWKIVREIVVTQ